MQSNVVEWRKHSPDLLNADQHSSLGNIGKKINPQDTEIQRNIKEDLSVSKLKANIQILEDKTVHYSTKYLEIDEELLNEIKSLCTEETHDFLETLWDHRNQTRRG